MKQMQKVKEHIIAFFKKVYSVWFPWLDIVLLTLIYLFLWGEHINPYRHYQLIKYGEVAVGKIFGEAELYQYSDSPRMRDFQYTLPYQMAKSLNQVLTPLLLIRKVGQHLNIQ